MLPPYSFRHYAVEPPYIHMCARPPAYFLPLLQGRHSRSLRPGRSAAWIYSRPANSGASSEPILARIIFGTSKPVKHYAADGENAVKGGRAVYMSSVATPVNQPDALRLLLDRVMGGADVTLINEGDGARVLLDLATDCLAERRSRVLRAAEVLPGALGMPTSSPHGAGPSTPDAPDDQLLTQSFQALTVLDQTCDRIVLLVSDAHVLQYPALRYLQFACRSGAPLQFVFSGTREIFDLLNPAEFAWLRARLMAGLVVTLTPPIAEASDTSAGLPSTPERPAGWVKETAVPYPGARVSAVSDSTPSWTWRFGALALLGLGGAACLTLSLQNGSLQNGSLQNGTADRPTTDRQAAAMPQPAKPRELAAVVAAGAHVYENAVSHFDPEASTASPGVPMALTPTIGSDAQGAGSGSRPIKPVPPSSAAAPGAAITVWSQTEAGVPASGPNAPGPARSLNRQNSSAASSRTVKAASGSRVRRVKEAKDQAAPLSISGDSLTPQPTVSSRERPDSQAPRYIGSYAADANGVRMFRLEP